MNKRLMMLSVLPMVVLGCSPQDSNGDGIADGVREPDSVSVVAPATPKGTVSGQVLTTTFKPLDGATVSLTIGSQADAKQATTDAQGNFVFSDVPAGAQVLLTISKSGYASARANSVVPSAAGNIPINNGNASFGPIALARLDTSLRFAAVTPLGRPAAGAKAVLDVTPAGALALPNADGSVSVVSKVSIEATANDQGVLTFDGVPSPSDVAQITSAAVTPYRLWIAPLDTNADGIPDTGGDVETFTASQLVTSNSVRLVSLPYARPTTAAFSLDNTNVGSLKTATDFDPLRNMVRAGDSIYMYFNQAVQPNSLLVRLTDEYASELLSTTVTLGAGGYMATVTPGSGVIQDGKEYNIYVRAVSAEGGASYTRTGFFFGGDPAASKTVSLVEVRYQETLRPPTTGSLQLNDGERVYVNFSAPLARTFVGSTNVQAFFNADLNASGSIGDAPGELGNANGFNILADEPFSPYVTKTPAEQPVFPITASGYTSRFSFIYTSGTATLYSALNPDNVAVTVAFSKLPTKISDTYESIWGQPVVTDLAVTRIVQQPAPTP